MLLYDDGSIYEPDYRYHKAFIINPHCMFSEGWFRSHITHRLIHSLAMQICDENEVIFKRI